MSEYEVIITRYFIVTTRKWHIEVAAASILLKSQNVTS